MSSDTPTPLVVVLRHNFKQKIPVWRVQGDAADEIERLTRELAEARADSIALRAWHSQFGTSQLSRAIAERDALKAEVERLREALTVIASHDCDYAGDYGEHKQPCEDEPKCPPCIARAALAVRGKGSERENAEHHARPERT